MTLDQKRKIAELIKGVEIQFGELVVPVRDTVIKAPATMLCVRDGQENWPLIGAIVDECERRGWSYNFDRCVCAVYDFYYPSLDKRTKTEAFCLAFLDAVEAGA